jgi:hypothetical protein
MDEDPFSKESMMRKFLFPAFLALSIGLGWCADDAEACRRGGRRGGGCGQTTERSRTVIRHRSASCGPAGCSAATSAAAAGQYQSRELLQMPQPAPAQPAAK